MDNTIVGLSCLAKGESRGEICGSLFFLSGRENFSRLYERWYILIFSLIIAILIIVLLVKAIGLIGAKTEEVRQRTKRRH